MKDIDFKGNEAAWAQFYQMIRDQFPHCKVEGLVIADGAPRDFRNIRYSKVPPRETAPRHDDHADFGGDWRWLIGECQVLKNGVLAEAHFRNGEPVVIYGDQQGHSSNGIQEGGDPKPSKALIRT